MKRFFGSIFSVSWFVILIFFILASGGALGFFGNSFVQKRALGEPTFEIVAALAFGLLFVLLCVLVAIGQYVGARNEAGKAIRLNRKYEKELKDVRAKLQRIEADLVETEKQLAIEGIYVDTRKRSRWIPRWIWPSFRDESPPKIPPDPSPDLLLSHDKKKTE